MNTKRLAMMMVVGLALAQGVARAETITGKVVSVDSGASRLVINQKLHPSGKIVERAFSVKSTATFNGFSALNILQPGQKVKVEEAENEKTRVKEVVSVTLEDTSEHMAHKKPLIK